MRVASLVMVWAMTIPLFSGEYAVCAQVRQDDASAHKLIETILIKEPNNIQCILQLANIHLKKGHVTEGFELVARAYVINPHVVKENALSRVLPSALKMTQLMAKATKGNDKESWNKIGTLLFDLGIFKEAAVAYEASLKMDEHQIKERLMFALSLQNAGQTYRAAEEFKKVLAVSEGHFFANYYLGKLLKHRIFDDEAAQLYLKRAQEVLLHSEHLFDKQEYAHLHQDLQKELTVRN